MENITNSNSTIIIDNKNDNMITSKELSLFIFFSLIMLLFGSYLWNLIWIKEYGANIPNNQYGSEEMTTFFHTKNYKIFLKEFFRTFNEFNKKYLIRSIGTEAYIYLIFQRMLLSLLTYMAIFSLVFSFISTLLQKESGIGSFFHDFLMNNKHQDDFNSFVHLLGVIIYTFLHFRFFSGLKREAKNIYFERFDMFSRNKDYNWLSSRTLHISGLAPHQRNTTILKKKLDQFLNMEGGGEVIDIQFIPNYQNLLKLERERNQLLDLKNLINKKENSFVRKYMFPEIYRKDKRILEQIEEIENKIQKETEIPVYSSGHAFVCFDSLLSANKCLFMFKEGFCKKLKFKIESLGESIKSVGRRNLARSFSRLNEELEIATDRMQPENIKILVDQMIEPYDIIWSNVGGDRGIYIFRQIFISMLAILMLIFLTTPTTLFSTLKSYDYLNFFEFNWIIKIPYGYIIKTYLPPLTILLLNLVLIYLIDVSAMIEKHYTHSRFQYSVFTKSFFYMLFNILIIPGITLTTANSLFGIFKEQISNIPEILSKLILTNSGYFFVTLIIQNATISPMFYILRLDELGMNSLSPFFAYYKRHFANVGKQWHRQEGDIFQYGYFYAQLLTFYTMALVFSSTVPFIIIATLYFFFLRHISDFYSLLCIHRMEIDSSGYLINKILKFSNLPVLFYQLSIFSFFIIRQKFNDAIIVFVIFLISLIYAVSNMDTYILNIYALHDSLKVYENFGSGISQNELNKWRNKFKHPLVLPIHLDEDTILMAPNDNNLIYKNSNINLANLGLNTENEASKFDNIISINDDKNLIKKLMK